VVSAKAGRKTLVLEKKKFPRDKYCGDGVCKTAIEILDEMGIYQQLLDENKAKIVSTITVLCTTVKLLILAAAASVVTSYLQSCLY